MIFTTLRQLADRVETLVASANDDDMTWWQVNSAIWRYVGRPDHPRWHHEADRNVWWWGDPREDVDWDRYAPQYLSSWDAAYGLVLPGWRLALAGTGAEWTAGLANGDKFVGSSAPGAPQAIVAAAIRSRFA
ncbi:hypothetical protein QE363_000762 [Sphingomonas sp. SORGH_AS870]|uniref:hypothetical protein n=1 Tax=Sphingomonas sp. SORGH_AS_0870 TaxID=3041801 RepID=UPI002857D0FF|nr:hypothetical protein [Sphingomonas sp. SORGH_AS_0870]MDR6144969.1 hypothetical protein [Sphingomonas sp. SORGH_AS_0870]